MGDAYERRVPVHSRAFQLTVAGQRVDGPSVRVECLTSTPCPVNLTQRSFEIDRLVVIVCHGKESLMQGVSLGRTARGAIAVGVAALVGVVMLPAPAAQADPTEWTCTSDTFYAIRGNGVNVIDVPTAAVTPLINLPVGLKLNAAGYNPVSKLVYAMALSESSPSTAARVINPDGTVEDVSAAVPLTGIVGRAFAGGTFTADGYWLIANGEGQIATIDLTSPLSPDFGTAISVGTTGIAWLSGDMAYRKSDDRVYFTTWQGTTASPMRVGWISGADFVAGGVVTPTYGPEVTTPTTVGHTSGFDRDGNLWMTVGTAAGDVLWKLAAADLDAPGPIIPTVIPGVIVAGSGSDGFSCIAPAVVSVDPPVNPVIGFAGEEGLADTGTTSQTMPIALGGTAALAGGITLMAIGGLRRRRASQLD